jgi:hypothetical protein
MITKAVEGYRAPKAPPIFISKLNAIAPLLRASVVARLLRIHANHANLHPVVLRRRLDIVRTG